MDKSDTSETSDILDQKEDSDTPASRGEPISSDLSEPPPIEKSNRKTFVIGSMVAGLVVVLVVGFFISQRKNILPKSVSEATPTPSSSTSPTATPKPIFSRSDWSLEVLNGSGVTGAAKKLADKLENLGYKVLKSGNADSDNYEKTEILVKKDLLNKIDFLVADLKDTVKIASAGGELKDSTASARIIIGKQ